NQELWDFFFYNYNGGPEIKLNGNSDLYQNLTSIKDSSYNYEDIRIKFLRPSVASAGNDEMSLLDNTHVEGGLISMMKPESP
ncbi:hypothetical protein, partial [Listeria monocytogenes]|uniref:hypothetical protein n=1 Tax=Listeria monocytogenes TaxID=1639 RepID=UPI002FDC536B